MCYEVHEKAISVSNVSLDDRFGDSTVFVKKAKRFCNPANKNDEDPQAPSFPEHLMGYRIKQTDPKGFHLDLTIRITNQFGTIFGRMKKPAYLMVPTAEGVVTPPPPLVSPVTDHFKCYKLVEAKQRIEDIQIVDQFGTMEVDALKPAHLCVPADKRHEGIIDPVTYLTCYKSFTRPSKPSFSGPFTYTNQFKDGEIVVAHATEICVPSSAQICGIDTANCVR